MQAMRGTSGARRILLARLGLLALSTLGSVLLLEVGLRVVSPPSPFTPLVPLRPHYKQEFHLSGYGPGISPVAHYSTNKWGLRGEEPPSNWAERHTIITVGGSSTECLILDDAKTWPSLLQKKLRERRPDVWVGNAGLSGQSARGHAVFVDHVARKIRPDMIVVLMGANDLWIALRGEARHGNPADRPVKHPLYRVFASSRLLQILYVWKQALFDRVDVQSEDGSARRSFARFDETKSPSGVLQAVLSDLPRYRGDIERIIELARSLGMEVVFLTQPLLFDDTEYWRTRDGVPIWMQDVKHRISAAEHWRLLQLYNRELLRTCKKEGVPCFDLASAVPHSSRCFYDAMHFNEQGAELVAENVARYLLSVRPLAEVAVARKRGPE
jgi:lysophospholipase L1-like esterase